MSDNILSIRFKNSEDKAAFLRLAELLHQTPSSLGEQVLSNHVKSVEKQKQQLSGYDLFFGKR